MGKIAIITLNDYFNYGNRLQNLALQYFLDTKIKKSEAILFGITQNY